MAPPSGLSFDYVSQEDLESAIRIEREGRRVSRVRSQYHIDLTRCRLPTGYPEDEAASPESLR